jgi:hypothetical protein
MNLFGKPRKKSTLRGVNSKLKSRLAKKKRIAAKHAEKDRLRKENESMRKQLRGY